MAERLKMAGENQTAEATQVGVVPSAEIKVGEIRANARLSDTQRIGVAEQSLGIQLTPEQKEGILKAHREAAGELGENNEKAGIYNYKEGQLLRKAKILKEAGFSEEQRRTLMELGLVGILPPTDPDFASFDPTAYDTDPELSRIAQQVKRQGDAEHADEVFFDRKLAEIEGLRASGRITQSALADNLLDQLESFRITALYPTEAHTLTADNLLPPEIRNRIERDTGDNTFARARILFEHYSSININNLSPAEQVELQNRRDTQMIEIENFVQEADAEGILVDVRKKALEFYKDVRTARHKDKYGRDRQQVIDAARRERGGYAETFWNNSPQLKQVESRFRGVAEYIWDGILTEVDKEVSNDQSPSLNLVVGPEFDRIKQQRIEDRRDEKKYITIESYYGRHWELTADNPEEFIAASQDWIRDQIAEIAASGTDVGSINKHIEEIRARGVELLENNRVRLEIDTGKEIPETNPHFVRAIAAVEADSDVLGNEKVIKKGGEEIGPQYKERFASNPIGHHDAIYLENPTAAYIMHRLKTHREGTYWLGQPLDSEKYSEGEIEDYRREIEEEIVEDAASHELFINEASFVARNNEGYSFDDNIEQLLLDPGDQIRQTIVAGGNADVLARHDRRVAVFRGIKERLDREQNLANLTPDQRNQQIRIRIHQKIQEKTTSGHLASLSQETLSELANANAANDQAEYDRVMWQWVKEYNDYRIKYRLPRWTPSGWDRVRLRIDRSTKVLDRSLSDEDFEAMFEPRVLPQVYNPEDINTRRNIDEARFGFQLARSYQIFTMQDALLGGMRTRLVDIKTGQYTGKLPDDETNKILGLIQVDAQGNILRDAQGNSIAVNPNRKLVRIFDIVQARLQDAISKEAAEIAQAKAEKATAIASGNQTAITQKTNALRELMINSQFLATHALKEKGLVDGKLPVWSYNFLDEATLDVFMGTLRDYGVEEYANINITHNNKKTFYEIMERGRRALKSESDRAAKEHMEGTYPVFARDINGTILPTRARSLWKASDDFGEPGEASERYRMINKGAVAEDRKIVDARYEISTSGGVAVTELIPSMGDIGFYPMLVWLGVTDIKGLHGYIHRRDEEEFHDQKFFDVMDLVQNAKAQEAAYNARKSLTGGTIKVGDKQEQTPGLLKEPYHGAFNIADWLLKQSLSEHGLRSHNMDDTTRYVALMTELREGKHLNHEEMQELERKRQGSYLDFTKMSKDMADDLYTTEYKVLDYLQYYLKTVQTVESNRRGRAPRNWEEDNHIRFYEWRRLQREAIYKGDKGFIIRLGYSPEVASEISIRMQEVVLMDADYLLLRPHEVTRRVNDGVEILSKVLTNDEKNRGFVIPDEKDWANQRPEIKKALETIRRRNLLRFMTEEGYQIGGKEILGDKIPPLVQKYYAAEDKTGTKLVSAAAEAFKL